MEDPFDIELEKLLNKEENQDEGDDSPPPTAHVTKVGFWFGWMVATGLGWIIGMVLFLFLGELVEPFLVSWLQTLSWGILGAIPGAAVGINQWYVLSNTSLGRQASWLRWWLIITIFFWMISLTIISGTPVGGEVGFAVSGMILGGVTGLGQAFVIRKEIPKWWLWLPINILSWAAGLMLIDILSEVVGFAVAGLLSGLLSGLGMIWLLNNYKPTHGDGEESVPVFAD